MRLLIATCLLMAQLEATESVSAQTAVQSAAELKHFVVTIRRFDPASGGNVGQNFVLPVDSPDEEHAIASTLANAASFSRKAQGGRALPVAFMAVRVDRH